MLTLLGKYVSTMLLNRRVLRSRPSYHQLVFGHGNFLNPDISENSIATFVRCDGMFNDHFTANLLT